MDYTQRRIEKVRDTFNHKELRKGATPYVLGSEEVSEDLKEKIRKKGFLHGIQS